MPHITNAQNKGIFVAIHSKMWHLYNLLVIDISILVYM